MGDVIIKFLGKDVNRARIISEDHKGFVNKKEATEYFLTTFLDNNVYKYGMTMITGLNKKSKFIISDKDDDRVVIENVDRNDPCFPLLEHAATLKINRLNEIKGTVAIAALATMGLLYFEGTKNPTPVGPDTSTTTEAHSYKEDYELMRKYYNRLLKGEISPAEVYVFNDLVDYYMENNSNLAEEDQALIRRYRFELSDYESRMVNVYKQYTK